MILVDRYKKLWRGPRLETKDDFNLLKDYGIKRIISLEYFDRDEDLNPEAWGMLEESIPCSDIFPPSDWAVQRVLNLVADDVPTYIHCYSGVDRTGFVCAAYRMQAMAWPYSAAVQEWEKLGRHFWYFWWAFKLKRWSLENT